MIDLQIVPVDDIYPHLDAFADVTIFHTRPWHQLLERSFGWKVQACVGYEQGDACVYFPFVRKRRLARIVNVCLPLSHRVGPIWRRKHSAGPLDLRETLWPIELHASTTGPGISATSSHHVSILRLSGFENEEALLRTLHKNNVQRKIRSAEKAGISVRETGNPADFARFSKLQSLTRQRQSAPTYPRDFFRDLAELLAANHMARLFLCELDGEAIAGVVFLYHLDVATYAYGASLPDRELWKLGANQAAMWGGLRAALRDGFHYVDFGSSPDSQPSLREYKERFGAQSQSLIHSFGNSTGKPADVNQNGLMARLGGEALRRLPQPLFQTLSPILLKSVL